MKKVIVEIDGQEKEYNSLSECAKALQVPVATVYSCASYGYKCKGHVVRYADGTRRVRHRGKATTTSTSQITAEDVVNMIANWYTKEWDKYISSDAIVSMTQYIRDNWHKS